jgi:hypothetical protein
MQSSPAAEKVPPAPMDISNDSSKEDIAPADEANDESDPEQVLDISGDEELVRVKKKKIQKKKEKGSLRSEVSAALGNSDMILPRDASRNSKRKAVNNM